MYDDRHHDRWQNERQNERENGQRRTPEEMRPEPQQQSVQPGRESEMHPAPLSLARDYIGSGKLRGKVAVITGGDSGIGRSTAICFAKEGADVVIVYFDEHEDAGRTKQAITEAGVRCLLLAGDIGAPEFVVDVVRKTVGAFGRIDVLVNNAAEQHPQASIGEVTRKQLEQTFRTNFFAMFELCRAALPQMRRGSTIINTSSVTAYRGNPTLLDYSATKGAIIAFTRSLAQQVADQGIRVNAVAPGPVWTPLIPASFDAEKVGKFGMDSTMGRPAQPDEISPCFVFLASRDSSYMTGQVLHPDGGATINT